MKQKPPVTKNQLVTLSIDGYGSEGQGVGRVDGYAVFVPGALPGEMVQVRILKPLSHFDALSGTYHPTLSFGSALWWMFAATHAL